MKQLKLDLKVKGKERDILISEKENYYLKEFLNKSQPKAILSNNMMECLVCGSIKVLDGMPFYYSAKMEKIKEFGRKLCCEDEIVVKYTFCRNEIYDLIWIIDFIDEKSFEIAKILRVVELGQGIISKNYELIGFAYYEMGRKPVTYVKRKNGKFSVSKAELGILAYTKIYNKKGKEVHKYKLEDYPVLFGTDGFNISENYLRSLTLYELLKGDIRDSNIKDVLLKVHKSTQINDNTLEILDKTGFNLVISELLNTGSKNSIIANRKGTKLGDKIKLTKPLRRYAKSLNEESILLLESIERKAPGISVEKLIYYTFRRNGISPYLLEGVSLDEQINIMKKYNLKYYYSLVDLERLLNLGINTNKIFEYLEDVYIRQAIDYERAIRIWLDYLSMSKDIKQMTESKKRIGKYPKSLKLAHDLAVRDYSVIKNEIYDAKIKKIAEENIDLEIENDEYLITFPRSARDLEAEGRALGHCVAAYAERIAGGGTKVAFIRSKKDPSKSLYTMEFEGNRILQLEGSNYSKPGERKIDDLLDKFKKKIA